MNGTSEFDAILRADGIAEQMDIAAEIEIAILNKLEADFRNEYHNRTDLSPAQRIACLSEIRKVVQLRCEINQLIIRAEVTA